MSLPRLLPLLKQAYGRAILPTTYAGISTVIAAISTSVGISTLTGWLFHVRVLTSVGKDWASMKPNTAIAFIAAGLALFLRSSSHQFNAVARILATTFSVITGLIGLISLGEYLLPGRLTIDELVFHKTLIATGVLHAGRPAFPAALGLSLLGSALLTLDFRVSSKVRICECLALSGMLTGFVALLGYIFGVRQLYQVYGFSSIAVHTASLLLLLGVGILCARPQHGLMAIISGDDIGGSFGRRLLPLVVILPMVNASFRLYGQRAGWYGTEVGLALNAGTQVCGLAAMLWISAYGLNRTDKARRLADQQLLLNEERMRVALKNSPVVVFNQDRNLRYTWIHNPRLAWAERGYLSRTDGEVLGESNTRELTAIKQQVLTTGVRIRREVALSINGQTQWFDLTVEPLSNGQGEVVGITCASVDINDKKNAEQELQAQARLLRALTMRLQQVREEERTMVARDLHDQIGQILTAVKMDIAWLAKHLGADQVVQDRLRMTTLVLSDALHSVRRICSGLRPGVLDDLGLAAAIEWQANEFSSRTGIFCDVSITPADLDVSNEQATAIFRIFQEALTNVARHAEAHHVRARLLQENGQLEMVLEDNGKGIRESEIAGSLGILGMKERAQMCGGVLQVFGTPGQGTTVMLRMPGITQVGEPCTYS